MPQTQIILITFISIVVAMVGLVLFIGRIVMVHQKMKNHYEREMLRIKLEVQDQTLAYICREIHDNIGQSISLAKLHLNTIKPEKGSKAEEKINHVVELLGKSLDDLRELTLSLTIEEIEGEGLANAIERQVIQLRKTDRFSVHFEVIGSYDFLDGQKDIIVVRILQESINNIIRHAHATAINILLEYGSNALSLQIKDNGVGFDTALIDDPLQITKGRGMFNMRDRARLIGADFTITSDKNSGTTVNIKVPLNLNNHETEQFNNPGGAGR